jgi:hypothetical protein
MYVCIWIYVCLLEPRSDPGQGEEAKDDVTRLLVLGVDAHLRAL